MKTDYAILKYHKKFIFNKFEAIEYSEGAKKSIGELERIFKRDINKPFEHFYYFKLNSGKYCFARAFSKEGISNDYTVECLLFDYIDFYPFRLLDCKVEYTQYADVTLSDFNPENLKNISGNRGIYILISKLVDGEGINIIFNDYKTLLAALYYAFPIKFAKDIFFTTDEDFSIDVHIKFVKGMDKLNAFNLNEGKMLQGRLYEFTNLIELAYTINMNYLFDFHNFLEQFEFEKIGSDIDNLYWLYKVTGMDVKDIDREVLIRIIEFSLNLSNENIFEIFKALEKNFEVLITKLNIYDFELILKFLIKNLNCDNLFLLQRSQELIRFLLDEMILKEVNLDSFIINVDELFNIIKEKGLYFIKSNLKDERIEFINAILNKSDDSKIHYFYLYLTVKSLLELDYTFEKALKNEGIKNLIEKSLDGIFEDIDKIKSILKLVSDSPEFFSNLFVILLDKAENELKQIALLGILISIIDQKDEFMSYQLRSQIKNKNSAVLYEEFKVRLDKSEDKVKFFEFYTENVLEKFDDFYREYFEKILKDYLSSINDENIAKETIKTINKVINEKLLLSDDATRMLVEAFEKYYDFKNIDEVKDIIKWIKLIKKIRKINTSPDITALLDLGIFLEENQNTKIKINDLIKSFGKISFLTGDKYKNFLLWTLPNILRSIEDVEDHKSIIYFYNPEDELEFYKFYISNIFKFYEESEEAGYHLLLTFLVYFYFYVEPKYRLYGEENKVEEFNDFLILMFSEYKNISVEKFNLDIINEFESSGLSVPIMWKNIYEKLLKR
ncbi:MAG: hypothetical protein N2486_00090 [Caloramator sp.]|nr:hypothetical protein [Caloramator sp.]